MKQAFRTALMSLAVLSLGPWLCAQAAGAQSGQSDAASQHWTASPPIQIAATGCLRRGNQGGYFLTDQDGNTWKLSSKTVDLAAQVNHSVTVGGKPGPIEKPLEPNHEQSGVATGGRPAHALEVLTLKTLSPSCTR
ncbi:MAG TPA: hypothetical protein VKV05_04255 [Terriglobales bacterium]|nr:hypothetical protein [Terriglobales bacterium]